MSERILLVQLADIGNLILTTPALVALREARPDAHIALLAAQHAAPVVADGLVDERIALDRRVFNSSYALVFPSNFAQIWKLGHYDTVVFFHHFTLRSGTFKFWLIAKSVRAKRIIGLENGNGWFLTDRVPDGGFGAEHEAHYGLALVSALGAALNKRGAQVAFDDGILPLPLKRTVRVIIHPGSGGYNTARRWYPERFAAVADALQQRYDAEIVLVGTKDDGVDAVAAKMQQRPVNLGGKTSLTQLADVIRSADLYIGADSGIMHLAAAVRVPVVALFGPTNADAWGPWSPGGQTAIVRNPMRCSPCAYVDHELGARAGCTARTCMQLMTVEQVLAAAHHLLDGTPWHAAEAQPSTNAWSDRVNILGLPVDRINYRQWMSIIDQWMQAEPRLHHVMTINPEFIMIAQGDAIFAQILRRADLCLPDGVGLLWASGILGKPIKQRVTGSDGIRVLAKEAAQRGWRLFLLGAGQGIATATARILCDENPGLQIAGTFSGSPAPSEEDAIVGIINDSKADILLVAYGAPEQDKWIARNSGRLRVKMAMGVGGSFDFVAGVVPRAPLWMRENGLEWLYRLYKNPRRIWRMLRLPRFVVQVILRGAD